MAVDTRTVPSDVALDGTDPEPMESGESTLESNVEPNQITSGYDMGQVIKAVAEHKAAAKKAIDAACDQFMSLSCVVTLGGNVTVRDVSEDVALDIAAEGLATTKDHLEDCLKASARISRVGFGGNRNVNTTTLDGTQINRTSALIGLHGFRGASKKFGEQVKAFLKSLKSR